ncbi:hypothetical protein [Streptomyces hesseae]|uniref:Lipoprotein n=1 Tax=Streptomyces hesseae TaxID=3075519 RepID=A0ABU2SGH7_9ACTN|nr:hypothetical protein [Streptomyces sp. DSM 40473]MDT0447888.1 hypothetical protein [Streptomyces sp. DSM 40473]
MAIATVSRPAFRRRLAAACGLALATALTLTGCTGDDKSSTRPSATASASASASASTSPSPSPSPTESATHAPTPSPEPSTHAPKAPPKTRGPQTEPPAPGAERPAGANGSSASKSSCEIRSNAGNCYKAGQYCRDGDVGANTHAANGRLITCGGDGGRPRWHY